MKIDEIRKICLNIFVSGKSEYLSFYKIKKIESFFLSWIAFNIITRAILTEKN